MTRTDSKRVTLRKAWLAVHRWLGLTVGLLLVLIGLTGSLLVFDHAIDEWLHPQLLLTQGSGTPQPVAVLLQAAEAEFGKAATSATRPRVEDGVWTVWFASGVKEHPTYTAVYVDPYTAKVTGQRVWGRDLISWIYRLHYQLVAGTPGMIIVGLTGIVLIVSTLTGIVLWWPLFRRSWRAALAVRRGKLFHYDLHKSLGALTAVFLVVISFTGAYMEFYPWVTAAIKLVAKVTDPPENLQSTVVADRAPIAADEAIRLAQKQFPYAKFDHLHPPTGDEGFYEVAFRQAGEVQRSYGRSQVFLDQYTGEILALRRPQDSTLADRFIASQFPLHNGEAFGLPGRWLVFFAGLTPAVFYVTGAMIWWRKRQSRHRQAIRSAGRRERLPPVPREIAETLHENSSASGGVADEELQLTR